MSTLHPAPGRKILLVDVDGTLTDSFPGIRDSFLHALDNNGIERPDEAAINRIPGPPMIETLRGMGLPDDLANKALQDYLDHQTGGGWSNAAEFPGMKTLLTKWREQGVILSTATSKSMVSAQRILEHYGMLQYFHVLAAADPSVGRQGKAMVIDYALEQLRALPELGGQDGSSADGAGSADDADSRDGADSHDGAGYAGGADSADGADSRDGAATLDPSNMLLIGDRIHDVEGAAEHGIASVLVGWGYGDDSERARATHFVETPQQLDDFVQRWLND